MITIPVFFMIKTPPPPTVPGRYTSSPGHVSLWSLHSSISVLFVMVSLESDTSPTPSLFRECVYQLFRGRQTPSPFNHLYVITNGHNVYSLNLEWAFC